MVDNILLSFKFALTIYSHITENFQFIKILINDLIRKVKSKMYSISQNITKNNNVFSKKILSLSITNHEKCTKFQQYRYILKNGQVSISSHITSQITKKI
jgi:hypothetical protein